MFTAALCFAGGFLVSALGVYLHQLWVIYLGYGVICGAGLKPTTAETMAGTQRGGPLGEPGNTAIPPARISPAAIGARPRSTAECQTEPRQRPHSRAAA